MSIFIEKLKQKIIESNTKPKIVFAEGWSDYIKNAAEELAKKNLIEPILIFRNKNETTGITNPNIKGLIIDSLPIDKYANALYEIRKNKGMTLENAKEEVRKPNVLASLLVKLKHVDGEVCGKEYSTKDTLKPALQIIKTSKLNKLVFSLFILERENLQMIFADCAININPSSEELVEITKGAITFAKKILNINNPITALLSYSTLGSGSGETVNKVIDAYNLIKQDELYGNEIICGEIQFDAAYVDEIRKQKAPNLNLPSRPNIYIFPTLDAGNIGYKIAQHLGGFEAIGPILVGLNSPVNDLSRGASISEIINVAIITAAQTLSD